MPEWRRGCIKSALAKAGAGSIPVVTMMMCPIGKGSRSRFYDASLAGSIPVIITAICPRRPKEMRLERISESSHRFKSCNCHFNKKYFIYRFVYKTCLKYLKTSIH